MEDPHNNELFYFLPPEVVTRILGFCVAMEVCSNENLYNEHQEIRQRSMSNL
jgi:hypothetical protein